MLLKLPEFTKIASLCCIRSKVWYFWSVISSEKVILRVLSSSAVDTTC